MRPEILLVDDDAADADIFLIAAKEAGMPYPVRWAAGGEAALELLSSRRVAPVLVLLDIKMPGIDGLETLRRLRADPLYRELPVVMLTGSDLERDREQALRLGCSQFLTKPANLAGYFELAARIRRLLPAFGDNRG